MRILHVSWEYPPVVYGGLGRHVTALAHAQAEAGHDVVVVTQHGAGASYDEVVGGLRVVRATPESSPVPPPSELLAWVHSIDHSLARAGLRVTRGPGGSWTPDVVHAHDWVTAHAGTALAQASRAPLVATIHATEAGRHQGWLPNPTSTAIHAVEWSLAHEAGRVIACSNYMRAQAGRLFELSAHKIDVIPNGVDAERWQAGPRDVATARALNAGDGPLLVFAGRLEHEKGVHTLLRALPRLRRRAPGLRAVITGRGTYEGELRELARRLRLGRAVRFAGWLPDAELTALLAAAEVVVVPSLYEPFGMVALEAAAVGTPLVVAATGGLAELVVDGCNGVTFPPGDVAALADAVTTLLRDEVLARRLADRARDTVLRDRDWPAIATRTVATYAHAISGERTSAQPRALLIRDGNLLQ